MLQINDIRQSRVYQEALEEGRQEGIALAIGKLIAERKSALEIATMLGLDVDLVRRAMANTDRN